MIKAVLVDDEILVLQLLERNIRETNAIEVVGSFTDPEQALALIPKLKPDVVFLDVDMPELNGIELGTRLIESNEAMSIVFVTAYEQYAIHAFKLNAIHYILKPVDEQSVQEVVKRLSQKQEVEEVEAIGSGKINFFGSMHLMANESKIDFLTAKLEELLALLVIHREKGISKWVIIDVLWEEASIEKSQQNLYTMMFRLKKTLRDAGIMVNVSSKNSIYRIEFSDVHCDVIAFDRFMKKGLSLNDQNLNEFEKAISLYQGDLLEEKGYLWCMQTTERYYQEFLNLVKKVAKYHVQNQRFDQLNALFHKVSCRIREEDFEKLT